MKKVLLFLLGFFLLLFYIVSVQVKQERFKTVNFDTTVRIQDNIPQRLDEALEDIGFFVSPINSIILVVILTAVSAINVKSKRIYIGALIIPIAFGLLVSAEIVGKARVESPAPPFFMLKNPITIFPKYHVQEAYSYPSGHAARSLYIAVIASTIILKLKKSRLLLGIPVLLMSSVGVIAIGKIYLGHHWLTDIIGGWIIACACLALYFLCKDLYVSYNGRKLETNSELVD